MKIYIEQPIKKRSLDDINYIIDLVGKHTKLEDVKKELLTANFPNLGIGFGSSHLWAKQLKDNSMDLDNDRTLFITS